MVAPDHNATSGRLDSISRALAQGVSRREALRRGGIAFAGAMTLSPMDAWARVTGRCRRHHTKCGKKCCPPGEICVRHKHKHGKAKLRCQCPPHTKRCHGKCVKLKTDVRNCGKCGKRCHSNQQCVGGKCVPCTNGQTACSGICVSLSHDPKNCGACSKRCTGGLLCANGKCVTSCPPPTVNCSGGCTNIDTDPFNCGKCGTVCGPGKECYNGQCINPCPSGLSDCSGGCVDVRSDPQNCGGCGTVCGPGLVCASGSCASSCPSGQTDCNGVCVDTTTNVRNCGACGHACPTGQVCSNGMCIVPPCPASIDCSGSCCPGTGCCGINCQTTHSNGVGQSFYDCLPPGRPGMPSTYSLTLAREAARTFSPGGQIVQTTCPGSQGGNVVSTTNGSNYATWQYSGALAGYVNLGTAPTCPSSSDPTWS